MKPDLGVFVKVMPVGYHLVFELISSIQNMQLGQIISFLIFGQLRGGFLPIPVLDHR